MTFITTFPKAILDLIVSQYYKNNGMLSQNERLWITDLELREDDIDMTAEVREETLN